MATLFKYSKKQSLPTTNETQLPDAVTRKANKAVENVIEERSHGVSGTKRKYTHFTPEVIVPSNCTGVLQPLDLSVNKPLKDHLRSKFQSWYSDQVSNQMDDGNNIEVDMKLTMMKPLSAMFVYDYLRNKSGIVRDGFVEVGICEVVGEAESDCDSDAFADIDEHLVRIPQLKLRSKVVFQRLVHREVQWLKYISAVTWNNYFRSEVSILSLCPAFC